MPDLFLVKGVSVVARVVDVEDDVAFITVTFELIGPFGHKFAKVRASKDGLLEPGGPSA